MAERPPPVYATAPPPPVYTTSPPLISPILQTTFGEYPVQMICPHCQSDIITKIETEPSKKTHFLVLVLCLFGFCCAPIAYCLDPCLSKKHFCPKCQAYLGVYDKLFGVI